jgi:hypothetical protein
MCALVAACSNGAPAGPSGKLSLSVAPLSLPGIVDANYDLWVTTTAGTVWSEPALRSTQYGDGSGSLTYIGTCDAQAGSHTVHLQLNALYTVDGPDADTAPDAVAQETFVNPCPSTEPCTVTAACVENGDTPVEFNLTVMRDAQQGFFDVAVNFNDIFCSAKVDCLPAFLHNGAGVRSETAIIGFACTSGTSSTGTVEPTNLYVDYRVNGTLLDESVEGRSADGSYAIYRDDEELPGVSKGFWNAAILVGTGASIRGSATAAPGELPSEAAGTFSSYPVIRFDVDIAPGCVATGPDGADVDTERDPVVLPAQLDSGEGVDTHYADNPAGEGSFASYAIGGGGTIEACTMPTTNDFIPAGAFPGDPDRCGGAEPCLSDTQQLILLDRVAAIDCIVDNGEADCVFMTSDYKTFQDARIANEEATSFEAWLPGNDSESHLVSTSVSNFADLSIAARGDLGTIAAISVAESESNLLALDSIEVFGEDDPIWGYRTFRFTSTQLEELHCWATANSLYTPSSMKTLLDLEAF